MKTKKKAYDWQTELKACRLTATEVRERLQLTNQDITLKNPVFPLRAPEAFLKKIALNTPDDPLLKQILPVVTELKHVPTDKEDPLNEAFYTKLPGLIHKYANRVLLTVSQSCAIHCRYCFRRNFPYEDNNPGKKGWQEAFAYIHERPEIDEVILSGGDPLSLGDDMLAYFVKHIAAIPHVRVLRLHTRTAVVMPSRLTDNLISTLTSTHQRVIMVVHVNHPNEIDDEVNTALKRCRDAGMTLLNQSVLLQGVNDSADTLCQLSWRLLECGVIPYYLHLLDPVQGAAHFAVSEESGRALIAECETRLPGYLVPRLVREEPGQLCKTRKA